MELALDACDAASENTDEVEEEAEEEAVAEEEETSEGGGRGCRSGPRHYCLGGREGCKLEHSSAPCSCSFSMNDVYNPNEQDAWMIQ